LTAAYPRYQHCMPTVVTICVYSAFTVCILGRNSSQTFHPLPASDLSQPGKTVQQRSQSRKTIVMRTRLSQRSCEHISVVQQCQLWPSQQRCRNSRRPAPRICMRALPVDDQSDLRQLLGQTYLRPDYDKYSDEHVSCALLPKTMSTAAAAASSCSSNSSTCSQAVGIPGLVDAYTWKLQHVIKLFVVHITRR
jgi:hypothetical protein